jgi:N-acetylglucosaminyl-diphospho-decaprenol L-rhamnosyltransferase
MIYSVVVSYNGFKWIDTCLGSLLKSTIPIKVIVIDNGSSDGTPEWIHQNYPQVEIIEAHQNLGFGKANNEGIKNAYKAGAGHVFLLNQDAWVEADTIEKLAEAADRHPEYGIISPAHLNGDGSAFDYGFLNYLCRNRNPDYFSDLYLKSKEKTAEIYELDFVNAAFWLLPRRTIEAVGGFNPFFFQYGEDRDYVNRCHYFDLKAGFVPSARAYHARVQHDSGGKMDRLSRVLTLIDLFDPRNDSTIGSHINSLGKSITRSLLRLQIRQAKRSFDELRYYRSNRQSILAISQKLKTAGLTFLDL